MSLASSSTQVVAVTGASGGIGQRLCEHLRRHGVIVVPFRRSADAGDAGLSHLVAAWLERLRPDAVIHLAGLNGAASEKDPERAHLVNVDFARDVSKAANQFGVRRFVLASSASVYGDSGDTPFAEHVALRPRTEYGLTKAAAEEAVQHSASAQTTIVALRIFNVYGLGMDSSLVNRIWDESSGSAAIVNLVDRSDFIRDYVSVVDVAHAFWLATSAPIQRTFEAINVGSGVATSNQDLYEMAGPAERPRVVLTAGEPSFSVAAVDHLRRTLRFVPKPLPIGLQNAWD